MSASNKKTFSLWKDALNVDDIPKYPTYTRRIGQQGDRTYRLKDEILPYVKMIEDGVPVNEAFNEMQSRGIAFEAPEEVSAIEGELLCTPDLRYISNMDDNLLWRADIRMRCEEDEIFRTLQYLYCQSDIRYYVNTWVWTDATFLDEPNVPLITYPFQDTMLGVVLHWIKTYQSGGIEKSREMGATWVAGACIDAYCALFIPGFIGYNFSLTETDVDNRTTGSILGKVRYIFRHHPEWLRGGWIEEKGGIDNKMIIKVPKLDARIEGKLSGGTAGRSGRGKRALYDESAFFEDDEKVLTASSSLARSSLWLSTANGMGNSFYRMMTTPNANKITLNWREHPMKNASWALMKRSEMQYTDSFWSKEHEIAYDTSTSHRVFPNFKSSSADKFKWCHIQHDDYFKYDPAYDVYTFWDFGIRDPTSLLFAQIRLALPHFQQFTKDVLVVFAEEEKSDRAVEEWADLINNKEYDGRKLRYRAHVGDFRSGNQRTPTLQTWITYLGQLGIHIQGRYNNEMAPIIEVERRLAIPGAFAIYANGAPNLIKSFQNWSFPEDKTTHLVVTGSNPNHDQWSHRMKAVCYGMDWLYSNSNLPSDDLDWQFQRIRQGRMI